METAIIIILGTVLILMAIMELTRNIKSKCFKKGYDDGMNAYRTGLHEGIEIGSAKDAKEIQNICHRQAQPETEAPELPKEIKNLSILLHNIDNYDGTERGQVDFEK